MREPCRNRVFQQSACQSCWNTTAASVVLGAFSNRTGAVLDVARRRALILRCGNE